MRIKFRVSEAVGQDLVSECQTLREMAHPNILAPAEFGYDGKGFFSEYDTEEPPVLLEQRLKKRSDIGVDLLWKWCTQVLSALRALESRGLRHGHLDARHIIIDSDGNAKIFKSKADGVQSDIYGFGMLLYQVFSEKMPPKPFKKISPRIPDKLASTIYTAIAPNPEDRFESFDSLIKSYRTATFVPQIPTEEPRRPFFWLMPALAGISVVILVSSYILWVRYVDAIPEKAVPDVVGLTIHEAEHTLAKARLKSVIAGERFDTVYSEGVVIESKPPSGRLVKQSRVVRLFLSKGLFKSKVADFVGRPLHQVVIVLDRQHLVWSVASEEFSVQVQKGFIIRQTPTPNLAVAPSENIAFVVSKGFPVIVAIEPAKVKPKTNKTIRSVRVELFLKDDWPSQHVSMYLLKDKGREELFSRKLDPGDAIQLEYQLEYGSKIEVYFNEDLALAKTILDATDDHEDAAPAGE